MATNPDQRRRVRVYSGKSILLGNVLTGSVHPEDEWLCISTKNQVIEPLHLREFVYTDL